MILAALNANGGQKWFDSRPRLTRLLSWPCSGKVLPLQLTGSESEEIKISVEIPLRRLKLVREGGAVEANARCGLNPSLRHIPIRCRVAVFDRSRPCGFARQPAIERP